jgi:site-specific DNA recombinase
MTTVVYARQSLDRDGERAAVGRQLEECRALASRLELTIEREYIDNDVSATLGSRPEFQNLLADVRAGEVDTILVWHTDRLYRRLRDLVELVELAELHALRILTVRAGDLDLNNPAGRMLAQMLGAAARYEIEAKSARQIAANTQRARAGVMSFSQRPYGYERIGREIRIVESEAIVLRESVNRFVGGESWYSIARDFRARGLVSQKGRLFTYTNLEKRSRNPILAGIRTYRGTVVSDHGDWPPIIDRETYDRMEAISATRRRDRTWDRTIKYLGGRIFVCGKCGGRMFVTTDHQENGTKYGIYQCENLDVRRRMDKVDAMVEKALFARLTMIDVLALVAPSEKAAEYAQESQQVRERLEGLAELYADGVLTRASVFEQERKLSDRLALLQRRLQAIEGGLDLNRLVAAPSVEAFWRDNLNIKAKRRVVRLLMTVTILPTISGGRNEFRPEHVRIDWLRPTLL